LTDSDSTDQGGAGFNRPWEDDEDSAEVVSLPGIGEDEPTEPGEEDQDVFAIAEGFAAEASESADRPETSESDDVDWEAMASKTGDLEFSEGEYVAATTQEYQGLAEEVSRASEEEWEMQAVAATLPGVESGLVGFDDVSGGEALSEESYEAAEQAASSDLAMRVASAVIIFGLFLGSLLLGGWWFSAFVILLMVVAVGELYATLRTKGYRPLALFGLLGVVLMGVGAHNFGVAAIGGWAAAVVLAIVLFFSLTPRHDPLENASVTVLGLAWVGMLSFAILVGQGPNPVAYIMFVVLLVALNDIGAYFAGRAFGRHKIAPHVSPNKTIEGFVGGLLVVGITASILTTFPAWEAIGLARGLAAAAVVGVVAPIGDFSESMVKRSIGVKDMGSVLPGHGGMLDRLDGFLFAVPAIYFLFRAFDLL
jgi:phosphatidate cytidylyltransferase